jgi:hypothetical protein
MKHIAALLLFLLTAGISQEINAQIATAAECSQYKTGTFYLTTMPWIVVTRDSTTQVEMDTQTGKSATYSVTWIDSCTYELRFVKSTDKKMKKSGRKIKVLRIQITSVDEEGYKYIATAPELQAPIRGSMKRKVN